MAWSSNGTVLEIFRRRTGFGLENDSSVTAHAAGRR